MTLNADCLGLLGGRRGRNSRIFTQALSAPARVRERLEVVWVHRGEADVVVLGESLSLEASSKQEDGRSSQEVDVACCCGVILLDSNNPCPSKRHSRSSGRPFRIPIATFSRFTGGVDCWEPFRGALWCHGSDWD